MRRQHPKTPGKQGEFDLRVKLADDPKVHDAQKNICHWMKPSTQLSGTIPQEDPTPVSVTMEDHRNDGIYAAATHARPKSSPPAQPVPHNGCTNTSFYPTAGGRFKESANMLQRPSLETTRMLKKEIAVTVGHHQRGRVETRLGG